LRNSTLIGRTEGIVQKKRKKEEIGEWTSIL